MSCHEPQDDIPFHRGLKKCTTRKKLLGTSKHYSFSSCPTGFVVYLLLILLELLLLPLATEESKLSVSPTSFSSGSLGRKPQAESNLESYNVHPFSRDLKSLSLSSSEYICFALALKYMQDHGRFLL